MELVVSIVSAVVAVVALVFSYVTYKQSLSYQRKQATLDAYNILQQQALDALNRYTKTQIEEISKDSRSEKYKEISVLLARCEHFATGVTCGIYDKDVLRCLAKGYFKALNEKMMPMILKKRKIGKDDSLYLELEKLAQEL